MQFDVIVIGSGPGGYVAAIRCAQLGLKTAIIEKYNTFGGTCLNVGCIPSKALLDSSEHFYNAQHHFSAHGIEVKGLQANLTQMIARKNEVVSQTCAGVKYLMDKNKITVYQGVGSFIDAHTVEIKGENTIQISAKNIIIATGSKPNYFPGMEPDKKRIITSTEALNLSEIPKKMLVIGGGVIGLELGSVWLRLGAQVTVVEYLDQILPGMDGEVRKEAAKIFKKQGFNLRMGTKVTGATVKGGMATLTVEPSAGGASETIEADCVLVAIGRRPNTDGLAMEKAGLTVNTRGQIEIGHDFQTNVPGIYAIGDVCPGPMLAHKAEDEGIAAAEFVAGLTGIVNHDVIPGVVYTYPEIASVGLTEEEAKEKAALSGGEVKVGKFPMMANSRAKTNRDTDGFVKVIADAKTDRVLGVHIIASIAGAMIAEACTAMEFGATSEDIAYTCHAHPTHAEALKEAAMAVTGKPIHM